MDSDHKFYSVIVLSVLAVLLAVIGSVAAYNIVDRAYQGRTVITYPATVTPTK